jgi:hypothetical protein
MDGRLSLFAVVLNQRSDIDHIAVERRRVALALEP